MPTANNRLVSFRAKREIDGLFIYGQLLQFGDSGCIFDTPTSNYPVDITTKGESVGITDKLGIGIYEGDVVIAEENNKKDIYIVVHRGVGFVGKHYQLEHYIDLTTHDLEIVGQYFSTQFDKDIEYIKRKILMMNNEDKVDDSNNNS